MADPSTQLEQPLPWQRSALGELLRRRARWPHAFLIHGAQGHGKRALAIHLAAALLCEKPQSRRACGECQACGWLAKGAHPDLRLLEPETEDEVSEKQRMRVITVRQLRDLQQFIYLSSHREKAKVVLIHPAEAMNEAAANALLKMLEEPPDASYFFLVGDQFRRLPATVISRCQRIAAPTATVAQAVEWLESRGLEQPQALLAQAGGAPLVALQMGEAIYQQQRALLLDELSDPARLSPIRLSASLDAFAKQERKIWLERWLTWLATWTYDLTHAGVGASVRYHVDYQLELKQLATQLALLPLFRYYRDLLAERGRIEHPLQPRLIAESLLFRYRQLYMRR